MGKSKTDKQKKFAKNKTLTQISSNHTTLVDTFKSGELVMKGNITTREICFVCKSNLIHDERRNGCFCPEHPQVGATTFIVRFGSDIYRRFKNYQQATQFLTGLRYKTGEGSYDPNDYRKENPNGFRNLSERDLKSLSPIFEIISELPKSILVTQTLNILTVLISMNSFLIFPTYRRRPGRTINQPCPISGCK